MEVVKRYVNFMRAARVAGESRRAPRTRHDIVVMGLLEEKTRQKI